MRTPLATAADWCCETAAWYYRHSANVPAAIGSATTDLLLSIVRRVCNPDPSHRRHR